MALCSHWFEKGLLNHSIPPLHSKVSKNVNLIKPTNFKMASLR